MHKAVVGICIVLGSLAAFATGSLGIMGYLFGAFSGPGGAEGLLVLIVGPLSILPAGLVGKKRPVIAGLWLLGDALFCFFMFFVVDPDGYGELFQPHPSLAAVGFNAAALFVALLGIGFLWSQKEPIRAAVIANRRWCAIVGGTLGSIAAVGAVVWYLTLPVWVVTVIPDGQASTSFRFDPRYGRNPEKGAERVLELQAGLRSHFAGLFKSADREILGKSVFRGPGPEESSVWKVVRDEKGLILILQDTTPIDKNWMVPDAALSTAVRAAADQILTKAWREHPPAPPRH